MTLTQLQQFQAVCQFGSISKAAEYLHISQPSISNSIKNLEAEFEVNLFCRNDHQLRLTQEGNVLLEKVLIILENVDSISKIMLDIKHCKNHFRLNVDPMIGATFFPKMYQSFQRNFPNIHIEISGYSFSQACRKIGADKIDIAMALVNKSVDDPFQCLKLWDSRLFYCINRSHELAVKKSIKTNSLSNEPIILFKKDNPINEIIRKNFIDIGARPNVLFYSEQIYMIKQFIAKGIAGSFLLKELVYDDADIVSIPLAHESAVSIALLFKKNKYIYKDEEAFINFAKTYKQYLQS